MSSSTQQLPQSTNKQATSHIFSSFRTVLLVASNHGSASENAELLLHGVMLLKDPKYRIICISSMPLEQQIIEYYWDLLELSASASRIPFSNAKLRLVMFNCMDDRDVPLARKILSRPRLMKRIRDAIQCQKHEACMNVFDATPFEQELADKLNVTLLAGHVERLQYYCSKYASKVLFTKIGVPTLPHTPLVFTVDHLAQEIEKFADQHPDAEKIVIKLNEGFSGQGNAILNLAEVREDMEMRLREGGTSTLEEEDFSAVLKQHFPLMKFQGNSSIVISRLHYEQMIRDSGAFAELWVEPLNEEVTHMSCEGYCDSSGEVTILSTHEQQILDVDARKCIARMSPASEQYRTTIVGFSERVGKNLKEQDIQGYFGLDFMSVQDPKSPNGWSLTAVGVNMRTQDTLHPNMLCNLLTNSVYDLQKGVNITQDSHEEKYYLTSDNIQMDEIEGLLPQDLRDYEHCEGSLCYSPETQTGVVFHLLGDASEYGRIGATAIANSPHDAQGMFEHFLRHFKEFVKETDDERQHGTDIVHH